MKNESAPKRSPHAQLEAMRQKWPSFFGHKFGDGTIGLLGLLQPQGQPYRIEVYWNPKALDRPYVIVGDPVIAPRAAAGYEDIPHLMFNDQDPTRSGLCLFDPAGREWTPADLIAETTIYWTADWLLYYELWHLRGEWLGPGVGHESIGRFRAEQASALRRMISNDLEAHAKGEAA